MDIAVICSNGMLIADVSMKGLAGLNTATIVSATAIRTTAAIAEPGLLKCAASIDVTVTTAQREKRVRAVLKRYPFHRAADV